MLIFTRFFLEFAIKHSRKKPSRCVLHRLWTFLVLLQHIAEVQDGQNDADEQVDLDNPTNDAGENADDGNQTQHEHSNAGQDHANDVNQDADHQAVNVFCLEVEREGENLLNHFHVRYTSFE